LEISERQGRRRWVVARFGANMHYAVPRMLSSVGCLARFYTDFYVGPVLRKSLSRLPERWRVSTINRALGRFAADLPAELVHSYTALGLEYSVLQRLVRNPDAQSRMFLRVGDRFGKAVVEDGFAGANGFYGYNTSSLYALRAAKERGLTCVLEQASAPRMVEQRLIAEEYDRFPGWEKSRKDQAAIGATIECERAEWAAADVIICPSEFVRDGVVQSGGAKHKCAVVPYGVDCSFSPSTSLPHTGPLRVLTVGRVSLPKGAGCAREVARALGRSVEFRWVGPIHLSVEGRRGVEECIRLVGPLPRSDIFEHFKWADVFFLPTVCEGSATVAYEALMSGLPVVTTPNAGSIVTHGVNGFIVPVRDSAQMALKLRLLHEDRRLLQHMRERAAASREAHVDAYRERLLAVLDDVPPTIDSLLGQNFATTRPRLSAGSK
jgi:glycosyltransferase involved in cell wall biosynthesis